MATTDRVFTFVTAEGPLADVLRTRIAPLVLPKIVGFEFAREFLFRTVSQITLNYRGSPLSVGTAGDVHGGDRLPWAGSSEDNFVSLTTMTWQVHVYGALTGKLRDWCTIKGLPLHEFDWHPEHEKAGLAQNAVYLLRPDSYVALADASGSPDVVKQYFAERHIMPTSKVHDVRSWQDRKR